MSILAGKKYRIKEIIKRVKNRYKANVYVEVDNKSLIAQKRVIRDIEYMIEENKKKNKLSW